MRLSRKRRHLKPNRISLVLIWSLLLQMLLQPFTPHIYAADIEGFTITKTASKSEVAVGESFTYTIRFEASSSVAQGKNIVLTDAVPSQFEILEGDDSWEDGGWDSRNGQILSYEGIIPSGTSVTFSVPVKARATGSTASVPTVNTAVAAVDGLGTETAEAPVTILPDPDAPVATATPSPTATPTATPSPVPTATPTPVPVYDEWSAQKSQNTGNSGRPIVDGEVKYTVTIARTKAGNTEHGELHVPAYVDKLPADATFVSSTQGGVYNSNDHTVTWSDIRLSGASTFSAEVTVRFADNLGYSAPSNGSVRRTNTVTLDVYSVDGGTGTVPVPSASVDTFFGRPKSGMTNIAKSRVFEYRWLGQEQSYTISGLQNNAQGANKPLRNIVISDVLPPELAYTSISLPANWSSFEYRTSGDAGTWKSYGTRRGQAQTLTVGTAGQIPLAAGESLLEVKWTFGQLAPSASISNIVLKGIVKETYESGGNTVAVTHGNEVRNTVQVDYEALNPDTPEQWDTITKSANAVFKINNPKPYLGVSKKWDGSGPIRPLSIVPFSVTARNDVKATGGYDNPVIYDLLPPHFEYYTDPKIADPEEALAGSYRFTGIMSGTGSLKLEKIENFNGTGQTLLKWYWDGDASLPVDREFTISYKTQVMEGAPQSSYTNRAYFTMADPLREFWHNGDPASQRVPDHFSAWAALPANANLLDTRIGFDPTAGVNEYFLVAAADVTVRKSAVVKSTKWNRGDLEPIFMATNGDGYIGRPALPEQPFAADQGDDTRYTEYPYYSVTYEGGTADYKLVIRNSGNTRLGKIDVLDILPHVGDKALLTGEPRGSQWQPNLSEVLASGDRTYSWTANTGSKTVSYQLQTFYSKLADESANNSNATVNFQNVSTARKGWIAQSDFMSDNLTDIRSLYFEIAGIHGSDGAPGMAPGDYIVLSWKMDAPVGAPVGQVAWNSFAIQASELNGNGGEDSKMLPTAPNKVGFIIDPESKHVPLGEIGDFVWFDSNRNGIQDEAYPGNDNQAAGINGITVNLYQSGAAEPFKSAKTGYDINGKPGYYLFQGLEAGSYEVEFVLPDRYKPTTPGQGGREIDSEEVTAGSSAGGYTPYLTDVIMLGDAEKIRSVDLGIVEGNSEGPYPASTLTKNIAGVLQGTSSVVSRQYVLAGNTVQYEMTFTNDSSVPLHNIRFTDEMDRSQGGFRFTELQADGIAVNLGAGTNPRPEVISRIANTGPNPEVVVRMLEPGQSIVLKGEYTVTTADIDGTDLGNTVSVYYNESPEPKTDEAQIPTAGLRVEKLSSALAADTGDAGSIIDYVVRVTNIGSYPLTNLTVTDSKVPAGIPAIPSLAPGEMHEFTYPYTLTAADVAGASIANTVTVKPDEAPPESATHQLPVVTEPRGSIGNYVWLDRNEDGLQGDSASEPGINGVIVKLYADPAGPALTRTVTRDYNGQAGHYLFKGLREGSYYVEFIFPADYGVTKEQAGDSDKDSNWTEKTPYGVRSERIDIGPPAVSDPGGGPGTPGVITGPDNDGWNNLSIDLGLVPRGEIGNYVWMDGNRNGVQDDGETGINGITVKLFKDSPDGVSVDETQTGNGPDGKPGYYLFDDLLNGTYYVQFIVPVDYNKSPEEAGADREKDSNPTSAAGVAGPIVIGEAPGWVDHSIDLGLIPKGVIGDYVWLDANANGKQDERGKPGLNGITVKLYDANKVLLKQTAAANDAAGNPGSYRFENLTGGTYYVKFEYPSFYATTRAEAPGTDSDNDSNKLTGGFTEAVILGEDEGWEDVSIDLGLIYAYVPSIDPPPGPAPSPTATPSPSPSPSPGTGTPTPSPGGGTFTPSPSQPPVIRETTPGDTPVGGEVNTPGGDVPPYVSRLPEHGTVVVNPDGTWLYTPDSGFSGQDAFIITYMDEDGNEQELLIEIDVGDVPLGGADGPDDGRDTAGTGSAGVLPKTGEESRAMIQLLGAGLVIIGAVMRGRRRRL